MVRKKNWHWIEAYSANRSDLYAIIGSHENVFSGFLMPFKNAVFQTVSDFWFSFAWFTAGNRGFVYPMQQTHEVSPFERGSPSHESITLMWISETYSTIELSQISQSRSHWLGFESKGDKNLPAMWWPMGSHEDIAKKSELLTTTLAHFSWNDSILPTECSHVDFTTVFVALWLNGIHALYC